MYKRLPIIIYGILVLLIGILLVLSSYCSFKMITLSTGITLTVAGLFAFLAAYVQEKKQVQFVYHSLHSLAMILYGSTILLFGISIERFIDFTTFLFVFYAVSEIIFCNWLFNLNQKTIYKTIIIRFMLGLAIGFGAAMVMNFKSYQLESFGVLFVLVGINMILYTPAMKGKENPVVESNL